MNQQVIGGRRSSAKQKAHARRFTRMSIDHGLRERRLAKAVAVKSNAELIAEALAAGRVQKIPNGVSGLPES